tara:strand:- start:2630 stop:3136 length:507 start_codon:yes stop_codon:yes gene_type:complete
MARAKKYPDFEFKKGVVGRHRVAFKGLAKSYRRFLMDHKNLKNYTGDYTVMSILFGLHQSNTKSIKFKWFYDWRTKSLKKIDPLKESYNTIKWKCAISGRPIKSNMDDFSPKNFVHPEYWDTLGSSVDMSIVESSVKFRIECQKLLLNEQKELLDLFKRNANPKKELD